jgi:hypothetical protein
MELLLAKFATLKAEEKDDMLEALSPTSSMRGSVFEMLLLTRLETQGDWVAYLQVAAQLQHKCCQQIN